MSDPQRSGSEQTSANDLLMAMMSPTERQMRRMDTVIEQLRAENADLRRRIVDFERNSERYNNEVAREITELRLQIEQLIRENRRLVRIFE